MLYIPYNFAKVFIGMMVLFAIHRLFFILYQFTACTEEGAGIMLRSFYKALPLDVSTTCYVCLASLVFIIFQYASNAKIIYRIHRVYLSLIVFTATLIAIADIVVYKEMNVKIHFKLLAYLEHPSEIFQSAPSSTFLIGFPLILLFTFFFCKFFFKFYYAMPVPAHRWYVKILVSVCSFGALGLMTGAGLRGGFQPISINESQVYYSKVHILNDAAVNPSWGLMHSYLENNKAGNTNPYIFMPQERSQTLVKEMYATADSSYDEFTTTTRPNIVYLILESWAADVVGVCGGEKGITPQFDSLSRSGILFSNAYASGQLSHQGIPSILSAYPSQPITSIIQNSNKYPGLPCINRELKKEGYTSSFYFGGQLVYGNIRSYIYYNQFDVIKEKNDLSADDHVTGKLGIHDEKMLSILLDEINKMKPPFFSCLFTLSSHSPYDMPVKKWVQKGGNEIPYTNSIIYTDSCLGDFFQKAKLQPWYKNTLFVIVADHSHHTQRNLANSSPEHNHIPLLICGGAVKENYRGKVIDRIASQTDIAATVLAQLKIPHSQYRWSKNLFDTTNVFAFYSFYNGFGFVTPKGNLVWDKRAGSIFTTNTFTAGDSTAWKEKATAHMQELFQDYLDL